MSEKKERIQTTWNEAKNKTRLCGNKNYVNVERKKNRNNLGMKQNNKDVKFLIDRKK